MNKPRIATGFVLMGSALFAASCGPSAPSDSTSADASPAAKATDAGAPAASAGWSRIEGDERPQPDAAQRAAAEQARLALFSSLMTELAAAMQDGGPGAGIEVCAERAPAIAAEVSESHGVKIGRTSFRLRNPANTPPVWAIDAVNQRVETTVSYVHEDGRFATLKPIRLAANCLMCHGAPEQLAPGVSDTLAIRYPADQATGFGVGDLRGWFWIEVPEGEGDG